MKLKYKIPVDLMVISSFKDGIKSNINFNHNDFTITINLIGSEIIENKKQGTWPYSQEFNKFEFIIEDFDKSQNSVSKLLNKCSKEDLCSLLTTITNRVIFAFRNFGAASGMHEFNTINDNPEYYLDKWEVKYTKDNKIWVSLVDKDNKEILYKIVREDVSIEYLNKNIMSSEKISEIEESINEKYILNPQQEFLTNSFEHFKNGNFRLSLVESIIALEIILNQCIRIYLSVKLNLEKSKIDEFVKPQLGLTARVSVLLHILLSKETISKISIDKILQAVKWRNHITHKTGNFPDGLDMENIKNHIVEVWNLVKILSKYYSKISTEPELEKIAKSIEKKPHIKCPTIEYIDRNTVWVRFIHLIDLVPKIEFVKEAINRIIKIFEEKDKYFNAKENLIVDFQQVNQIKHRWHKGDFIEIKE